MKAIGVVGGMGPYATADFFSKLLREVAFKKESDCPRILIDNDTSTPSRTLALKDNGASPVPFLEAKITTLERMGADFVVVPCNSAHFWRDEVLSRNDARIPWLDMIEIVSDEAKKAGNVRPLVLGGYVTIEKKLYSKYLPDAVYPEEKDSEFIYGVISSIKLTNAMDAAFFARIKDIIRKTKPDSVLLACTELSKFSDYAKYCNIFLPFIDSQTEYARAAIRYAKE